MLLLLLSFFSHHIHIVTSQTDSYNNHLNHNHTPVSDSYGCGNCSGVIYSAGAGFHCHQDDKNSIIRNKCQMESPYPKCMPGYFEIKYPIKEYCCFWNSKLGCGILVNEKYFGDNDICHKQCHCFCHRTISGAWKIKFNHGLVILLSVIFVASNNF